MARFNADVGDGSCHPTNPICAAEFTRIMDGIGCFETRPLIAVGVSGGSDSMALMLLANDWARARGGRAVGLTVDHGLRDESSSEAVWVAKQLNNRGIESCTLTWSGEKPRSAIQEKAGIARRTLMLKWCGDHGALHLGLAHHADDQVETHLMRLTRGSGPAGLAAMSAVREHRSARVIRPLLTFEKARVEKTLSAFGQNWLTDPSNDKDQFERVRVRKAIQGLGLPMDRMSDMIRSIHDYGSLRNDLEKLAARVIAISGTLYPAGYACLDTRAFDRYGAVAARHALSRLIMAVGGRRYPVAKDKLLRAHRFLRDPSPDRKHTVGGCLLQSTGNGVLITREVRNLPLRRSVDRGQSIYWDSRFQLSFGAMSNGLELGFLGEKGWGKLVRGEPDLRHHPIPLSARYALPALFHNDEIVAVSHLTEHYPKDHPLHDGFEKAAFLPCEPVLGSMFSVALTGFCTISEGQTAAPATDERIDA